MTALEHMRAMHQEFVKARHLSQNEIKNISGVLSCLALAAIAEALDRIATDLENTE